MVNTVSKINYEAKNNTAALISAAEEKYKSETESLADRICKSDKYKIILLAGPSGSGKTTTAHIISAALAKRGVQTAVISLDNFYGSEHTMPRLENGDPDYESVYSLDVDEIHRCFSEIIDEGYTDMPIFDFMKGGRLENRLTIDIRNHGILIVEGLHALNPVLADNLPKEYLFKIYISVNESILDDDGSAVLTSRQMRLIRRMSRDFIYRNSTAENTLKLWTGVIAGEEKYLYGFKPTADVRIVTLHNYEPCVFRDRIIAMLSDLNESCENFDYVIKTAEALKRFVPIDPSLVPKDSLLREFMESEPETDTLNP